MKRFLALALSMLMILGVLLAAGCNNNGDTSTTKAPSNGSSSSSSSSSSSESSSSNNGGNGEFDPTKKMPGYEDVDFGDKTFVIIGADGVSDGFNTAKEIYIQPDNEAPDAIDLAVDQRNKLIEQLYNCTIQGETAESPGTDASQNVLKGGNEISIYNQKHQSTNNRSRGRQFADHWANFTGL